MTYLVKPATWLAGYIPDLATPFDEDDRIDLTAFAKLCERQIEKPSKALTVAAIALFDGLRRVKPTGLPM
jgi:4-hydroxy-tetrahydrodipicolinate synthase